MENFFCINHDSEYVSKSQVILAKEIYGSPNLLYEEWLEKNWIILGWIQVVVGPLMYSFVMNHEMASDCKLMLEMLLSPQKVIQSQAFRDQLKALKKSENESMSDFVINMRALTDSLSIAEDRLRDVDIIDFVAEGLGPKFQPFISSIHSQPNMLFDEFLQLIIKKEMFLKKPNSQTLITTATAFAAKSSNWDSCLHPSHSCSNGNGKSSNHESRSRWKHASSSSLVCHICDKTDHFANTCQKAMKTLAAVDNQYGDGDDNWILDSGASSHMTPKVVNLSNPQEYSGMGSITIGNGLDLKITHIGTIMIKTNYGINTFTSYIYSLCTS